MEKKPVRKSRPEYVTCIRKSPGISYCGRAISMEFYFQDLEHAELSQEQSSRLTICDECWEEIAPLAQVGELGA